MNKPANRMGNTLSELQRGIVAVQSLATDLTDARDRINLVLAQFGEPVRAMKRKYKRRDPLTQRNGHATKRGPLGDYVLKALDRPRNLGQLKEKLAAQGYPGKPGGIEPSLRMLVKRQKVKVSGTKHSYVYAKA